MYWTYSTISFWLKKHNVPEASYTSVIRQKHETYTLLSPLDGLNIYTQIQPAYRTLFLYPKSDNGKMFNVCMDLMSNEVPYT
jgi:hypothetical protein